MFWNKVYCFYHFWILIKICSDFLRKSTARWSKLHSTSTYDLAEKEEQLSWITHNFLNFFENSSVKFLEIGENFMQGCQNCILQVRRTVREKNDVGEKSLLFYHFWMLFKICSEFLQKNFGTVVKLHFTSRDDHFKKEQISRIKQNFWIFLGIRSLKFWSLVVQLHARLSELHSTCTNEDIKKNLMFWNIVYCFYHFWISIKMCSDFLRKSTARWSKLHSTSTDDLAEKEEQLSWITHNFLHCFENSSVKFTEIGENFMHGCKNCILHVRRNNSRKNWCWGKSLLFLSLLIFNQNFLGVFAEKFQHGGQTCISHLQMIFPRKKNKSVE